MRFGITVRGQEQVNQALSTLMPRLNEVIDAALADVTTQILQAAQANAPQGKTGLLASTLHQQRMKRQRGRLGYVVRTGTRAQLGLKPGERGYYPAHVQLGFLHTAEFGSRHIAAQPFLRRALRENQAAVVSRLAQALERRLA